MGHGVRQHVGKGEVKLGVCGMGKGVDWGVVGFGGGGLVQVRLGAVGGLSVGHRRPRGPVLGWVLRF